MAPPESINMSRFRFRLCLPLFFLAFSLWLPAEKPESPAPGKWQSLFDGQSFEGWRTLTGKPVTVGWEVRDGAIRRGGIGGDILTAGEWADFELEFEWKVTRGANSGVKYRVGEYAPAGRDIGPEFQILDDAAHSDGADPKRSAGAIYDIVPAATTKKLRAVGEWNQSRVVARGSRLEHWLNGEKIVDVDLDSPEWRAALAGSKFKAAADFGTRKGHILLQDHGDEVWYRALRIRELPGA